MDSTIAGKRSVQPVVMIVDDDEIVLTSLGSFLDFETDYQILRFQSPREALRHLEKAPVDMIISDFLMPELNGLEFLSAAKKVWPNIPLVILTGYADKGNAIQAINDLGLYQYLEKPWDNDHLKIVVRNGVESKSLRDKLDSRFNELTEAIRQKERLAKSAEVIDEEFKLAGKIQRSMLPAELPAPNGIQFSAFYKPAEELGGDFYDVIPLAEGCIAALIADATGHGMRAALTTALVKFAFASFAGKDAGPEQILKGMNDILCKGLPSELFVVGSVAVIDPEACCASVVNAGAPHPFVCRAETERIERIAVNGLLLGFTAGEDYQVDSAVEVDLYDGDRLIMYTDGLSETANSEGVLFEEGRLAEAMEEGAHESGKKTIEYLAKAADQFRGHARNEDDITIMSIEKTFDRR